MLRWAEQVKSGDPDNLEARAAVYYWKNIFPEYPEFKREREGPCPNHLLNYIYAILRGIVARALTGSGLLPTLGIHHHNQYNAYCLADDIMEPFRPFADKIICHIIKSGKEYKEMTTDTKRELLGIASADILIDGERSPLMVGLQRTIASLAKCYEGKGRKILYPEFM
jgi:CRISPR-associated protein Cas1